MEDLLGRLREWRQTLTGINELAPTAADVAKLRHAQTCWFSWDRREETLPTAEANSLGEFGRLVDAKIRAAGAACGFRSAEITELFSGNPVIRANAWRNLVALSGVAEPELPQPAAVPIVAPPVAEPADGDLEFTEPLGKSVWRDLLDCSPGGFRDMLDDGRLKEKPGTQRTAKLVALHIDSLPKHLKQRHDRKRAVDQAELSRKRTDRKT